VIFFITEKATLSKGIARYISHVEFNNGRKLEKAEIPLRTSID
jgi:hypothetical protein